MVDMGGYALHLHCTGQGSPTVILEGGLGGGVLTWPSVQPAIAAHTRVCSYDRSGWAWSGGTAPDTGGETAHRLQTLLQRAGEHGPYILVGHSLGGLYNQLFAAAFPDEVAGMVLVDARHQAFGSLLVAAGADASGTSLASRLTPLMNRTGLTRLAGHLSSVGRRLPNGMMEMALQNASQASARQEQRSLPTVEAEATAANLTLGDKPLFIITRDAGAASGTASEVWFETQRRFLALSANSRMREAPGSGHMIPYDNSEAVTDAILQVLGQTAALR